MIEMFLVGLLVSSPFLYWLDSSVDYDPNAEAKTVNTEPQTNQNMVDTTTLNVSDDDCE